MVLVDNLKRARKLRGLSLAQLAERIGIHPVSLARAERPGLDPTVSTLVAIAKALDVPVCELLDERIKHGRDHRRKRTTKR